MPGPPKTPTAILRLRGSPRERERVEEPQMLAEKLECPAWASESAREHWPEIAEVLVGMQVSTAADRGAMVLLVDAVAQYVEARKIVEDEGITATGSMGNTIVHPAVKVRDSAWARAMKAMAQFGMTPSSRAGVAKAAAKKDKADVKSRFFKPAG